MEIMDAVFHWGAVEDDEQVQCQPRGNDVMTQDVEHLRNIQCEKDDLQNIVDNLQQEMKALQAEIVEANKKVSDFIYAYQPAY